MYYISILYTKTLLKYLGSHTHSILVIGIKLGIWPVPHAHSYHVMYYDSSCKLVLDIWHGAVSQRLIVHHGV